MHVGVVVKVSKLCNMRCAYCCEMDDLANPKRMSVPQIRSLSLSIAQLLSNVRSRSHRLTFYWHGGEPFAQPIGYWQEVLAAQQDVFGPGGGKVRILNAIQSNLTLLTPRHLPLLTRFRLGFSFDVVNDLRVFAGGQSSVERIVSTIDWLTREKVPLAGIVVVSTATVGHAAKVARFYIERHLPFRFIQLDEGLEHLSSVRAHRVSYDQYLRFAEQLFVNPMVRRAISAGLRIDPLSFASQVLAKAASQRTNLTLEECAEREHLLEIDTDGTVYSTADYPYRNPYGNIFTEPIEQLLLSPARIRRIEESTRRLNEVCSNCELFRRGCIGTWVAHATRPQYEEFRQQGGCELRVIAQWMRRPAAA